MPDDADSRRSALRERSDQPSIDLSVALDLLPGGILPDGELSTSSAEALAKRRIAGKRRRAPLESRLVAEEHPGPAVLDDRTIALDVRSEHGATEPERLEHRVGHAALRKGAIHDDIGLGQERAHLRVRNCADVASPRTRRQVTLQSLTHDGIEHRADVDE